jgi:uncharacterized protein (TIGR03435 family)
VKPNTSGSGSQSARSGKASLQIINMPMRMLIVNAYGVRPERVVGGPGWIDSDRFDVNARAPENTPDSQLSVMLRTTLAERFTLVIRSEMREQPLYALVLARSDGRLGPNLKPSTDVQEVRGGGPRSFGAGPGSPIASPQTRQFGCGVRSSSDGRGTVILGGARQLADLARSLEGIGDRVVIDRTGLAGAFDFELRFARQNLQPAAAADSDLPSVFTAVQEQLGLKLESQRGPVEFLVIESVEQPTPD